MSSFSFERHALGGRRKHSNEAFLRALNRGIKFASVNYFFQVMAKRTRLSTRAFETGRMMGKGGDAAGKIGHETSNFLNRLYGNLNGILSHPASDQE
jgi:hypothetical protein